MCGIFGLLIRPNTDYPDYSIRKVFQKLARVSEARGKDSSGITFLIKELNSIDLIKGDIRIKELLNSNELKDSFEKSLISYKQGNGFSAFGHARLVTNGSQLHEENNQPVFKENILIVHNGIITNLDQLWQTNPDIKREYLIDTEIIPALLGKNLRDSTNLASIFKKSLSKIEGTFSVGVMFNDLDQFVLATNNGSLYYLTDNKTYIAFASEWFFLHKVTRTPSFRSFHGSHAIQQLPANKGIIIDLDSLNLAYFDLTETNVFIPVKTLNSTFKIKKQLLLNDKNKREVIIDPKIYTYTNEETRLHDLLEYNLEAIQRINRCHRCLLPETFPLIEFDDSQVCNYCKNYHNKNQPKSIDNLKEIVEPFKGRNGNKPDCIVPFSGGRDSSYTLHVVKKVLGLNPIAFTYDWGMLTDLGRRNAARVCGKLGIENIIVAADIRGKRNNIKKNITAWLRRPHLGMVPIFMAGDKYFFYYSNKIQVQNNIELSIWGSNPLENTDFKLGFTGIQPHFNKKRIDEVKSFSKLRLAAFFLGNYLNNPSYINDSLVDTFGSFVSRYMIKRHGYLQLFDFIQWNESEVESLILNEYNWEKAIDTRTTWRIGDGTAAFYNYIYCTVAGFSENDTFRSNQIREGQLKREKGLELVMLENRPRYENLRWYLDIIGLDFKTTIVKINGIPKLYKE
ncbi:MAG: hypothetical protein IQL11_12450, partial [Bacteroidales bacterium]|nr:hypothetical protein [Bacteroidales bacterium]